MTNDIYMTLFIMFYNQSWCNIYIYRYISIPCSGFSDDSAVFDQGDAKARNTMTFAPRALWMSRMWQCKPSWHGRNLSPLRRHLVEIRQSERIQDIFAFLKNMFQPCWKNFKHVCVEHVTHLHHLLISSRRRLFAATVLGTCLHLCRPGERKRNTQHRI